MSLNAMDILWAWNMVVKNFEKKREVVSWLALLIIGSLILNKIESGYLDKFTDGLWLGLMGVCIFKIVSLLFNSDEDTLGK